MALNVQKILSDNWSLLTQNGLTKTCTYQEMPNTTYQPGNTLTKIPISETLNVEVVFDNISSLLVDGATILAIDRVAIFPALSVLPVMPKINDVIVAPSSSKWLVKEVIEDPADGHFELRVRPIQGG